ncbi:hypothetical protein EDD85DRAFT_790961 [Armillaria nabsnona]|nr:hypothetical protein EDD85DRAFT_790961 [Armillaria nabsnona]
MTCSVSMEGDMKEKQCPFTYTPRDSLLRTDRCAIRAREGGETRSLDSNAYASNTNVPERPRGFPVCLARHSAPCISSTHPPLWAQAKHAFSSRVVAQNNSFFNTDSMNGNRTLSLLYQADLVCYQGAYGNKVQGVKSWLQPRIMNMQATQSLTGETHIMCPTFGAPSPLVIFCKWEIERLLQVFDIATWMTRFYHLANLAGPQRRRCYSIAYCYASEAASPLSGRWAAIGRRIITGATVPAESLMLPKCHCLPTLGRTGEVVGSKTGLTGVSTGDPTLTCTKPSSDFIQASEPTVNSGRRAYIQVEGPALPFALVSVI